jgi:sugar lactone lactonase YvrE
MAFAADGSIYVADTRNHRILHMRQDGQFLHQWGSFADGISTPAATGTFNEPWGIGVGPDGSVFVSDTWNNRIQKFSATGEFIRGWGASGTGDSAESFYGPRGLAVDSEGSVYVADTGNKRIVVFDEDGTYVTQFGSAGFDPGQFDEPVGIAVDDQFRLYVSDTWNQRIQTFVRVDDGSYLPERQWDVYGWFGQSVDNKPFIAVDGQGQVYITDPEGYRVMQFAADGQLIRVWGEFGSSETTFGLPAGIAVDTAGHIWITDAGNNRVVRFTLP